MLPGAFSFVYNEYMPRNVIIFMILVFLTSIAVFVFTSERAIAPTLDIRDNPQDEYYQEEAYKNRVMDIDTFVSVNISKLSPVQETLGGKFFVTQISSKNGSGVVQYEDGHMQYTADFNYTASADNGYTITKFRIREN